MSVSLVALAVACMVAHHLVLNAPPKQRAVMILATCQCSTVQPDQQQQQTIIRCSYTGCKRTCDHTDIRSTIQASCNVHAELSCNMLCARLLPAAIKDCLLALLSLYCDHKLAYNQIKRGGLNSTITHPGDVRFHPFVSGHGQHPACMRSRLAGGSLNFNRAHAMSLALAALLSVNGLALATAAYLHAASQYLEQGTIKLQRLPALWPIYYRMLLSVLTKPRRLPTQRAMLPSMRIITGGHCRCACLV